MTRRHRTIIFVVFCILFVLIALPVVFYSQGYAFDFGKRKIVQTGGLFVETNVGEAEIYISGKLKGKTGIIFKNAFKKNLLPRVYQVELKKEGYWPWKKNLEVKEKLTTEIRNALLLPAAPEKQLILEKNIKNFLVSPDEKKIAYFPANNKLEVLNLNNNDSYSVLEADKIDRLLWSDNSRAIFFRAQAGKKTSYFIWQENSPLPTNLDKILKGVSPLEFKWHPKDSTQIYFSEKKVGGTIIYLYQIDLLNNIVSPPILRNVKNYEIFGDGIYFFEKTSGLLFKTDFEGKSRQQITISPLANYNDGVEYKIFILGSKIGLIDNNANFYLFNPELKTFEKSGENIKSAKLSKDSKKLLYYGSNEIWVLYLEDILIQPFKYKGDKELIGRFSAPIDEVFWYPDDEHLIISIQNTAKITELDGRDARNTMDFLTGEQIYYGKSEKKIYFLENGKLYSMKL